MRSIISFHGCVVLILASLASPLYSQQAGPPGANAAAQAQSQAQPQRIQILKRGLRDPLPIE